MKKNLIFLFWVLFSSSYCFGGGGYSFCFEVTVITNNGNFEGYIRMNLEDSVINLDSINNPNYFTKQVIELNNNGLSALVLHRFSIPILYLDNSINYLSFDKDTISINSIKQLKYKSTGHCEIGTDVLSKLNQTDESWARKKPISIKQFSFDVCGYNIQFYEKSLEIDKLVNELIETTKDINDWKPFQNKIKELDKFKVIVVEKCSDC